jgi:hypothetical protein
MVGEKKLPVKNRGRELLLSCPQNKNSNYAIITSVMGSHRCGTLQRTAVYDVADSRNKNLKDCIVDEKVS